MRVSKHRYFVSFAISRGGFGAREVIIDGDFVVAEVQKQIEKQSTGNAKAGVLIINFFELKDYERLQNNA